MNKKEKKIMNKWLTMLNKNISGLNHSDRKDIIENYTEMWQEELSQGKTSSEILLQLRPIKEISIELYKDFEILPKSTGEVIKVKIVNITKTADAENNPNSFKVFTKSLFSLISKFFASLMSVLAFTISILTFVIFVGIVIATPISVVLIFLDYDFLVALPIGLVFIGTSLILLILFYFLSSVIYNSNKKVWKYIFKINGNGFQKPKSFKRVSLVVIIFSASIIGLGATVSVVGENSIYGSVLANKFLHDKEDQFSLEEQIQVIEKYQVENNVKIDNQTKWNLNFKGYQDWLTFDSKFDKNVSKNTVQVQTKYNYKVSISQNYILALKNEVGFQSSNLQDKQITQKLDKIDLYLEIKNPWHLRYLSLTPVKLIINYNIDIAGLKVENIGTNFLWTHN